jgi:hypothetical protein
MKRPTLTGFAEACYDQNEIGDLIRSLKWPGSDETDRRAWKITAVQWRAAIADALLARILDRHRLPDSS